MFGLFKSKPRKPFYFPPDAVFVGKFLDTTIEEKKLTTYEYSSDSLNVDLVIVKNSGSKVISQKRTQLELDEIEQAYTASWSASEY